MKRRNFLTAAGTVGLMGTVSGSSLVSSAYSSINSHALMGEFSTATKSTLENFMADVALNIQSLGLDQKYAALIALPTKIVKKQSKGKNQSITYKNKSGNFISISINKGVEKVSISNTL